MKILLLAGGLSDEKEVSIRSGNNIETALVKAGHEVLRKDPGKHDFVLNQEINDIDLVFPILHGAGGEDGTLQAELEQKGVPFLGSGSIASSLTYDKVRCKEVLTANNILTPRWKIITKSNVKSALITFPSFVIKPITGGSSIDTLIVRAGQQIPDIFPSLERYDSMLMEELIEGDEITVGVLGNKALPVILIVPPSGEEFDYENKYNGKSQEIVKPNQIAASLQCESQDLTLRVHKLMKCSHISRTDIIITPDNKSYVLEINTIPGLTKQSLFPKAAYADGLNMPGLANKMVNLVMGEC